MLSISTIDPDQYEGGGLLIRCINKVGEVQEVVYEFNENGIWPSNHK